MYKKISFGVWISLVLPLVVALAVGLAGSPGLATAAGPEGHAGLASMTALAEGPVQPESCATCHKGAGAKHQASYNELYQDGVIQVTDLAYSFAPTGTHTITFKMTKDGAPFDARKADSLGIYFTPYKDGKFQFEPAIERQSLLGKLSYDGAGGNTSTFVGDVPDVSNIPGIIVLYGRDETIGTIPGTRVAQNRYPFAALLKMGSGVDYVSAANVSGCEKCHTVPYLKHSYIYGEVNHDPATDFYTCKACHLDNGEGGHFEWQLMVDDPAFGADYVVHETPLTPEQEAKYAYKTRLMNDVHMSHSMEFPYPQSMSNCATCHEGKLDKILTDANFSGETCKSCHSVTGSEEHPSPAPALKTIMPEDHGDMDVNTETCADCHSAEGGAPVFSEIHTGYDKKIYTADGLKYSEVISVTVDSASFEGNKLNIKFSAAEAQALEGIDITTITPTVLVSLYGYDTKDFVIGAHERLIDDNGDGAIDNKDQRALEYVVGEENPRFTTVSKDGGSWEVTADLSTWADLITAGTVKRVEIGVLPALVNAAGVQVALNAPSKTFDLGANAFADDFYSPIVKVAGCNNCHDALATTFHTPDRGGNVVVCRMCHIVKSGASHLEVQSRSIDSYVHAIHSFQGFDVGDINFADPVQALHYEEHVTFPFPTHANTNCEACHVEGKYNVPDQSKSLPGILSATDLITTTARNIPAEPSYITGPASRACGGCHRAVLINEDKANDLVSFLQHTKQGGYLIEAGDDPTATLTGVIDEIMGLFKK